MDFPKEWDLKPSQSTERLVAAVPQTTLHNRWRKQVEERTGKEPSQQELTDEKPPSHLVLKVKGKRLVCLQAQVTRGAGHSELYVHPDYFAKLGSTVTVSAASVWRYRWFRVFGTASGLLALFGLILALVAAYINAAFAVGKAQDTPTFQLSTGWAVGWQIVSAASTMIAALLLFARGWFTPDGKVSS